MDDSAHIPQGPELHIDIVFDTVCPWCYIGERRLQAALRLRPEVNAVRRWRPFMLNPDMPAGGMERRAYLYGKFGSEARIGRVYGAIVEAGHAENILFDFEGIERTPQSVDSHRLVQFAEVEGLAAFTVEALFHAYFVEGRDIGNREVLIEIGSSLGIDSDKLARYLESDADVERIRSENAAFHRLGINGVPAFIFNGSYAVSGAQEAPVLARAIDAAAAGLPA